MTGPPSGSLLRRVPAGVADSGLSSLGTFITGFLAVHYLRPGPLGAYAIAQSALILAGAITYVMVFSAVETKATLELDPAERAQILGRALRMGAVVAVVIGTFSAVLTLLVPSGLAGGTRWGLAAACAVVSTVSPLQDHVRRMLHAAHDSWGAALVSLGQLVAVAGLSVAAVENGLGSRPWLPFAVLAAANILSSGLGLRRARRAGSPTQRVRSMTLGIRQSAAFGKELTVAAVVTYGSGLLATALVVARAGSAAAGEAEAARVLVQPITLVAIGLLSVLGPDIMRSADQADLRRLRRFVLSFLGLLAVTAVAWGGLIARPWSWSPLEAIAPAAYVLPGLVLLTLPGQVFSYAALFGNNALQGLSRRGRLAATQSAIALLGLAAAALLAKHGAWALAISSLISGAAVLLLSITYVIGPRRWTLLPDARSAPLAGVHSSG